MVTVRGWYLSVPERTNTTVSPSICCTARDGTTSIRRGVEAPSARVTNICGFNRWSGFSASTRSVTRRVAALTTSPTIASVPLNDSPG